MTQAEQLSEVLLVLRSSRFSVAFLVIGSVLSVLFGNYLLNFYPEWAGALRTGLLLFLLWLVVTSTVRSLNKLDRDISGGWLLLSGVMVGGLGALTTFILLQIYTWLRAIDLDHPFLMGNVLFFAAVGFVLALITTINLRVKNRLLGNLLEIAIFVALGAILLYWMWK